MWSCHTALALIASARPSPQHYTTTGSSSVAFQLMPPQLPGSGCPQRSRQPLEEELVPGGPTRNTRAATTQAGPTGLSFLGNSESRGFAGNLRGQVVPCTVPRSVGTARPGLWLRVPSDGPELSPLGSTRHMPSARPGPEPDVHSRSNPRHPRPPNAHPALPATEPCSLWEQPTHPSRH